MLECVVNISEGRRSDVLATLDSSVAAAHHLDRHTCEHHNRSVFTLIGEDAPRQLAHAAVDTLDIETHIGAHPRLGVVDVVPFVALDGSSPADAVAARDRFAQWAAEELALPCFLYGSERTLPDVRRQAFTTLAPDSGPPRPHPTAGAVAVGARPLLVAYNLWLVQPDLALARRIAQAVRGPGVRALGLAVGEAVQVSMNLIDPLNVGPATAWDAVEAHAPIDHAELVGLIPRAVLDATAEPRWTQLGLSPSVTIEQRLLDRSSQSRGG